MHDNEEIKGDSQFSAPSSQHEVLAESMNHMNNMNFRASDPGRFAHQEINADQFELRESSGENLKNYRDSQRQHNRRLAQEKSNQIDSGEGGPIQQYYDEDEDEDGDNDANDLQREEGEYTFENGAVYCGQWLGRYRHGYGKQTWPDGARYEGEWLNNKAHGRGIFYHVDGDVFDGEWKNDKANGFGTYYNVNGSKYEGQWIDDLQEGYGKETWKDGSVYEGAYCQGHKHGHGAYVWSDGSTYDGEWFRSKIHG